MKKTESITSKIRQARHKQIGSFPEDDRRAIPHMIQSRAAKRSQYSRVRRSRFDTQSGYILPLPLPLIQGGLLSVIGEKNVHSVLLHRLGGLRQILAGLNDRPIT